MNENPLLSIKRYLSEKKDLKKDLKVWSFIFPFILSWFFSSLMYASSPAKLMSVKVQAKPTESHFIFILNKKTVGNVSYLPGAKKLLLDFYNTQPSFEISQMSLAHTNVAIITSKVVQTNQIRFVFSLTERIRWQIGFLQAPKEKFSQLKLDIFSTVSAKKRPLNPSPFLPLPLKQAFKKDALKTFTVLHLETKQRLWTQHKAQMTEKKGRTHFYPYPLEVKPKRIFNVVIDPGHGGKDSGARGHNGALEKMIVLGIANSLAAVINRSHHMRAILTRQQDLFVPLRQRLQTARKSKADVFVAIHADAFFNTTATGASVYALSPRGATTEAARWLAKRDNYSELGSVELDTLQDRSPLLRSVLIDLAQTATIHDSLRLGNKVLDALDKVSSLHYKHVAQAPFVVLKSPDIPSILVETGFISNIGEERRLRTIAYQNKIAYALYSGINQYVQNYAINGE